MELTQGLAKEFVFYDPETGIFTWNRRDSSWFKSDRYCSAWNSRFAGKRAGSLLTHNKWGYQFRQIAFVGIKIPEHRLAWVYMNGLPLPPQIDHINRDAKDNRWKNLRASSVEENLRNKSKYLNNTSGITGVSRVSGIKPWHAYPSAGGKKKHLGFFATIEEAERAVKMFHESNGFDPSHGTEIAKYHR